MHRHSPSSDGQGFGGLARAGAAALELLSATARAKRVAGNLRVFGCRTDDFSIGKEPSLAEFFKGAAFVMRMGDTVLRIFGDEFNKALGVVLSTAGIDYFKPEPFSAIRPFLRRLKIDGSSLFGMERNEEIIDLAFRVGGVTRPHERLSCHRQLIFLVIWFAAALVVKSAAAWANFSLRRFQGFSFEQFCRVFLANKA